MNSLLNTRILGAFVVGFALVAGAYVVSNFGETNKTYQAAQTNTANQVATPIRSAIDVADDDGNGIEDWRDEFVSASAVTITEASEVYQPPETLTGQASIDLFERYLENQRLGVDDNDRLVANTVASLQAQTGQEIYDVPDIVITRNNDPENIRLYANAVAATILLYSRSDIDNELLILQDILNRNDHTRLDEIRQIAQKYQITRDAILRIPTPEIMVKEHLDLINTLHAVQFDINSMTLIFEDPAYSLLRLKRYQDDVLGMQLALENFNTALQPFGSEFTTEDAAVFFSQFNSSNRIRI